MSDFPNGHVSPATQAAEILRVTPQSPEVQEWETKVDLIRRTVAAGATNDDLELFFHQARRAGLDPLAKQIYYVKRKGKGVIQVGIDGLRLIADRTGKYAGSDDAVFSGTTGRNYPEKATVTVYKMVQGQRCPFTATARWDEYFPGDDQGFQWKKMPHAMLGKCSEALALRKAFPADMSGLYIHEEMDQADSVALPDTTVDRVHPPGRDPKELLEAPGIVEAAQRIFGEPSEPERPRGDAAPDGKNAFGYVPVRWPLPKMFQDPATESQMKMWAGKCRERSIPEEDALVIRRLVLEAYGLEDDASRAAYSLVIDWTINADEESLDQAVAAAESTQTGIPLEFE